MNKTLAFIFRFGWHEKRTFAAGAIATILASVFTWLSPQILAKLIDESFVPKLLLFFALSELLKIIMGYLTQKAYAQFGQNVIERIREAMVHHLMKVPVSYYDRSSSGQIMTRVVNDVNSLTDFFQSGLVSIVGNGAAVFAIFLGMYSLNHELAIILFLVFVPFLYACSYFSQRLKVAYEDTRNELSHFNSMLADFLFGMKTIRSLSLGKRKHQALSHQIGNYSAAQVRMVRTFALFNPTLSLGIGILFLTLILKGIPMVDSGILKKGEWVAILSYIFSLQQPLMEITDRWNFFLAGTTSIDRIRNVFSEKEEKTGTAIPERMKTIELKNVSFRYESGLNAVLTDTSLTIRAGDRIGVFGETGMGKTTLLQILYGFYSPSSGEILWNGRSYSEYSLMKLRDHFGVVEQFPLIFSGTVEENISLFGKFPLDREKLLETFRGYRLIESILHRSSELVLERGTNFSMGERQMISFLRAYLKAPQVWILDEATAFFDPQAEHEFMSALSSLPSETVIVQIAHRKEALTQMKTLIQVHQGRLLV